MNTIKKIERRKNILIKIIRTDWFKLLGNRFAVKSYLKRHEIRKLQIGCSSNIYDDWLNTDLQVGKGGVYLDAGKRFPLPDNSFDYVYSEHLFEHLTYRQADNMLKESMRILKRGGVIRVATPSLEFLIGLYIHPDKKIHSEYIAWAAEKFVKGKGGAKTVAMVINNFMRDWGHQVLYDYETLSQLMGKYGFTDIHQMAVGESDYECLKGIEHHDNSIPKDFNLLETMVIEAKKP